MRAVSVALAASLIPSVAFADAVADQPAPPSVEPEPEMIVGGMDSPLGNWPDTAAILYNGQQQCTGTLIAPTVALTAGHCAEGGITPTSILIGTNSLTRGDGERINISQRFVLQENDTTVLVLAKPATTVEPRAIATGWATFDIKNGAPVQIVGYGATRSDGSGSAALMQEVRSTITDFDCSTKPGCQPFELGAGGMGIDSCFGDSGGPLYLITDYGDFLVGVTSRGYSVSGPPCGNGGIYGRPDEIVDIIEQKAGVPVSRGPAPVLAEQLLGIRGDAAEAVVDANDPKAGTSHTFEVSMQPTKGQAAINADGVLRVCIAQDAMPGDTDSVVVKVTDKADPNRFVTSRLRISVAANEPVSGTCDPMAFGSGDDGGGCCDSGGSGVGGSAALSLIALVVLRRRRK